VAETFRKEHAAEIAAGERKARAEDVARLLNRLKETNDPNVLYLLQGIHLPVDEGLTVLAPLLDHENKQVRIAAVRFLGPYGPGAAPLTPKLMLLLKDDDLRADVAGTLAAIGPAASEAVPALVSWLDSPKNNPITTAAVAQSLGGMGSFGKDGLPALKRLQESNNSLIAHHAFVAVGKIETVVPMDAEELKQKGAGAFTLVESHRAFAGIMRLPKADATGYLRTVLTSGDIRVAVRIEAINRLDELRVSDAVTIKVLLEQLVLKDEVTSKAAASALDNSASSDIEAVPVLAAALKGSDDRAAIMAGRLLWRYGSNASAAVPTAIEVVKSFTSASNYGRIRETLTFIRFQGVKAKDAAATLEKLLDVRSDIYAGRPPLDADDIRMEILVALAELGPSKAAGPAALDMLANSGHPKMFAAGAKVAASLPDLADQAIPLLIKGLNENNVLPFSTHYWGDRVGSSLKDDYRTSATIEAIHALRKIGGAKAKAALPNLEELTKSTRGSYGIKVRFQDEARLAIEELSK
jgi:hypothetical protein